MTAPAPRRALATRDAGWARRLARGLAVAGVRPNAVSVASVGSALTAGIAFYAAPGVTRGLRATAFFSAAAAIQLRLLCNLLDGLLAVEEGLKSATGDIYNEVPDRLADVVILAAAGYAIRDLPGGVALGWAAAVAAVFTAYVRVLAGSLGATQHFIGPMAKPHRMFTLTMAALLSAVDALLGRASHALVVALALIFVGSIVTAWRRIAMLVTEVAAR